MPTPHIAAAKEDIAKTVIMPGDPLRAKFIAENFLENAKLINNIRNICGYTGFYKGKRVSVMASGMGMPSMGIYSYELFNFYDVENIIRTGTCGGFDKDLHVKDIVIAAGACTNSNYTYQYRLNGTFCPIADFVLLRKAVDKCEKLGLNFKVGNVLSSDTYYSDAHDDLRWAKMGVLGVEMEAAALYCNAARAGKHALCICTISNSFVHEQEEATAEERQKDFVNMIKVALEIAE